MNQRLLQLDPPIWVVAKDHGEGRAIVLIDYGLDHSCMFLVQLNDGRFRVFNVEDCLGCENFTLGIDKNKL
jgi:hypothetical protein